MKTKPFRFKTAHEYFRDQQSSNWSFLHRTMGEMNKDILDDEQMKIGRSTIHTERDFQLGKRVPPKYIGTIKAEVVALGLYSI